MTLYCKNMHCGYMQVRDHEWVCGAIDFSEDNEYDDSGKCIYVIEKLAVIGRGPTPDWCPVRKKTTGVIT